MNIEKIDSYLELWDNNKLKKLWSELDGHSNTEIAFAMGLMTTVMSDDGEVRLSQWLVWLETKCKNQ